MAVDLLPELPTYPEIADVVKVTAPTIGNNVYPGLTQQYRGALAFGDREACYVVEPNGIVLGPGIYDARLVGSHLGAPLYATTCCPAGSFASSSAASGGSSSSA